MLFCLLVRDTDDVREMCGFVQCVCAVWHNLDLTILTNVSLFLVSLISTNVIYYKVAVEVLHRNKCTGYR